MSWRTIECLGENKEKYKTFSVPIKKEIKKIDKDGNGTISYKIKFIDNARFIASSLSNLVDNLTEGINKTKCKDCDCFFEYESVKDDLIKYVFLAIKIVQISLTKNWKRNLKTHLSFLTISINLFCW